MKRKPPRLKVETGLIPSGSQGVDLYFGTRGQPLPGQQMTEEELQRRQGVYKAPYANGRAG